MNPYFEQMVLSASPMELIRMLYKQAIRSVREAREHLKNRRIEQRCESINNACAVLMELSSSLRADAAPETASMVETTSMVERLGSLYGYMTGRLMEANLKQSDEPLAEVLGLLVTLSEGWAAVPDPHVRKASRAAGV